VFVRNDQGGTVVHASWRAVARTVHATTLEENGASVLTTEHLLAALWAMDVTNCTVELDGPEVPILDGSAQGWCELIREAGTVAVEPRAERPVYTLRHPVWIEDGGGSVLGLPHHELRVTVLAAFPGLEPQVADAAVNAATFAGELAPARTFTLEEWIEPLRAQGLIRGGSEENAIVLRQGTPSAPYRFENELARHKALDVVGDVALLFAGDGGTLQAHLIATRAGHGLHRQWMEECVRHEALVRI
jgi:UDP-3-O-[3-hydroxymyristoyl] N-acetylglucosamine deacetylase